MFAGPGSVCAKQRLKQKQNEIKIDRREQRHGIDEDDDDDDESDRDLFAVRICFILCVSLIRIHSLACWLSFMLMHNRSHCLYTTRVSG